MRTPLYLWALFLCFASLSARAVAPAPIGGPNTSCIGGTTTLTDATAGGIWTSSNTTVATIDSNSGILSALTAGTTRITYSTTGGIATRLVTVTEQPSLSLVTGTPTICVTSNIKLSTTVNSGIWSSSNPSVADTAPSVVFNTKYVVGVSPGTATISYAKPGCLATMTVNIPIVMSKPITGSIYDVCEGGTLDLNIDTTGGTWSSSNTYNATVNSSGIVTGGHVDKVHAGIPVVISYSKGAECVARTVTVYPLVAFGYPSAICWGDTISLHADSTGGRWESRNTGTAIIDSIGRLYAVCNGKNCDSIFQVQYIRNDTDYCSNNTATSGSIHVIRPDSMIAGDSLICVGETTTFSNIYSNGSWSSSNTAVASLGTILVGSGSDSKRAVITGVSAGTAIITFSSATIPAYPTSCITTKIVTVNALPNAGSITGTTSICIGQTTDLSSTGDTTGRSWSSGNTGVATINSSGVVTGVSAGTARISYTATSGGCTSVATVMVTVSSYPSVPPIEGTTTVCIESTTTLTNAASGGSWSSSSPAIATITAGVVTGISPGTSVISYTVTGAGGCTTIVTTSVLVLPLPDAGYIGGIDSVCVSSTTTLYDAEGGGYWSSSNTDVATVEEGVVTGIAVGTATISYTVSGSCGTDATTATVTVLPLPDAGTITGTTTVCTGSTTTLSSDVEGGYWSSSNTAIATVEGGVVYGLTSGTVTISYSVSNSCGTDVATAVVTILSMPDAGGIEGLGTVCIGSDITLYDGVEDGSWSSSNTAIATVSGGVVTGVAAGTATISYTVSNSCGTDVATKVVTVTALPDAGTITGTLSVCAGGSTTLSHSATGGSWSSSDTSVATVDTSGVVTSHNAGTTTISYTVTNSCGSASATKVVTVYAIPSTGKMSGTVTICAGATATLTNEVSGTWSISPTTVATITSGGIVTGVAGGTAIATFTVTGAGGCIATAMVTVNVNPTPSPITGSSNVIIGKTQSLTDATTGGTWSSSNTAVATVNSTTGVVTGVAAGTATITYTLTATGCYRTKTMTVYVPFAAKSCEIAPMELCDSILAYCPGFKIRISKAATSAGMDTAIWSPTIPATVAKSDTDVVFTFTAVPTMGIYTVTARTGSYDTTFKIRIVVAADGTYPCDLFKPQCGSDCPVPTFTTIWAGNLTSTHFSDSTKRYYLPFRGLGVSATYSMSASPAPGSVFLMGKWTLIQVKKDDTITLDNCHIFGSPSASWMGINVKVASTGNGYLRVRNNTLIENVFYPGTPAIGTHDMSNYADGEALPPTGVNIIDCDKGIFNHNTTGISLFEINSLDIDIPVSIKGSVFTNRDLCTYHTSGSISCSNYYPLKWPTADYLKTKTSDAMNPDFNIDQFHAYTTVSGTGVGVSIVGKTDTASNTYHSLVIGDSANASATNFFDSLGTGVNASSSNILLYNNIFRGATKGILVQEYGAKFIAKVLKGSTSGTHNRFYNCYTGFDCWQCYQAVCKNSLMRAENYINPSNISDNDIVGNNGINFINGGTVAFDSLIVEADTFANYYTGLKLDLSTSTICAGEVLVKGNVVRGITSLSDRAYSYYGITVYQPGNCTTPSGNIYITNNDISGVYFGINAQVRVMQTTIDSNTIKIMDTYPHNPYPHSGIRVNGNNASAYFVRNSRIRSVSHNHVYGDPSTNVTWRLPVIPVDGTTGALGGYSAIEMSKVGTASTTCTVQCNYIHDVTKGFSFSDTSFLDFKYNVMSRNKYGMLLAYYKDVYTNNWAARIGNQGSACVPSDNRWSTATNSTDWTAWGGSVSTDTSWQTYVHGERPDTQASILYVRNGSTYRPTVNGYKKNGTYTGNAYNYLSLLSSDTLCSGSLPSTSSNCNPEGGASRQPDDNGQGMAAANGMTQFSLFPNPTTGVVTIRANEGNDEEVTVAVRNYAGTLIYSGRMQLTGGSATLNISNAVPGLYFVTVTGTDGATNTFRLVIQQ